MIAKKRSNAVLDKEPAPAAHANAETILKDNTIRTAIHALLEDTEKHETKRVKRAHTKGKTVGDIMSAEVYVNLAITFMEAPFKGKLRPYAIPLKHSLHTEGEDEVCLFVKDPQRLVKDYLTKHGHGGVTRVLGIEKLRKRYKTFEARRELLQMYDHFLVDNRVAPMVPRLLGNAFLKSKRTPLTVNMQQDVVASIKRTLSSTAFTPRQGTSTSVRIAKADFSEDQVYDNLIAVVDNIVKKLPSGWSAIQSLNIKTNKSPALPVYVTLPTPAPIYKRQKTVDATETASAEVIKKKTVEKVSKDSESEDDEDGEEDVMEPIPALDDEERQIEGNGIEDDDETGTKSEDEDESSDEEDKVENPTPKTSKKVKKSPIKETKNKSKVLADEVKSTPKTQKTRSPKVSVRRSGRKRTTTSMVDDVENSKAVANDNEVETKKAPKRKQDDAAKQADVPVKDVPLKTPEKTKKTKKAVDEVKTPLRRSTRKKTTRQLNDENEVPNPPKSSAKKSASKRKKTSDR